MTSAGAGSEKRPHTITIALGLLTLVITAVGVVVPLYRNGVNADLQPTIDTRFEERPLVIGSDVALEGRVGTLAEGEELWLLDYDLDTYTLDTDRPLATSGDRWTYLDENVGAGADPGDPFQFVLVRADAACSAFLRALPEVNGDRSTRALPSSCRQFIRNAVLAAPQ